MRVPRKVVDKLVEQGVIPSEPKKPSKYRAKPVMIDGVWFASTKEANRYCELKLLLQQGEISSLQMQVTYQLVVDGQFITTYRADFVYIDQRTGARVVEDAKGLRLPIYTIKKRLMRALLGIEITEV